MLVKNLRYVQGMLQNARKHPWEKQSYLGGSPKTHPEAWWNLMDISLVLEAFIKKWDIVRANLE